jgi:hypothetical protein
MNLFYTMFKNSVRTSQETQCISLTVPYLVLFAEIMAVRSKNHTKDTNRICGHCAEIFKFKDGGTYSNHSSSES